MAELDERIREETDKAATQKMLAEARSVVNVEQRADGNGADMSVTSEPRVYGPESNNSWYWDQIMAATRSSVDPHRTAAEGRLAEWSHQMEREIALKTKIGKVAETQVREQFRDESGVTAHSMVVEARERGRVAIENKVEVRTGITTGGGATASASGGGGAAFVTPFFTEPEYTPYREFGRAFADQCDKRPLPPYGLAIYKPTITGPAGVSTSYTEGSGVTETDPTMGYTTAAVIIAAGQVTVSQAILDRVGPSFSFDTMIWDQLNRDYAPKFDTYVLGQALTGATSQSWTGNSNVFDLISASGSGGFYGQVSKAKASIRTTAGTVLNPTHLFMVPPRWEFISAWSDSQGRPVVVPDYAGPFNAAANSASGDAGIEGYTHARFNGLPVFTDNNIPTTTTSNFDQAIVADLSVVHVYEGGLVHRVLPQTLGGNLQTILQMYTYGGVLVDYPAAVVKINGSGMSAISYTN